MTATRTTETFRNDLQIDALCVSPTNPRQHFDPVALAEMAESISVVGVMQPIIVRPFVAPGATHQVVIGERRFRASKLAGMATIPGFIRDLSDAQAAELQIVENLQRADVHPVEEAEGYRALKVAASADGHVLTSEDIAKKVSKPVSHVAKLLKLLDLEIDAKLLFSKGAITIGHALLLAPLTPTDQDRALRFMLNSDPKYDKRPVTAIVRHALGLRAEGEVAVDVSADDKEGDEDDDAVSYNMPKPQVVKYMRAGRRVIDATEAQLKRWIEANVLLRLADVPWRLDDDDLVKLAGACDVCPKRSGSNIALFGQLTAEEDVCTDSVCFSAKQKGFIAETAKRAKAQSAPLAKLSSKRGQEKLPEVVTERTLLKAGQWVEAAKGTCPAVIEGLMRDGDLAGKILSICANQACKVHKHQVDQARASTSSSSSSSKPLNEAQQAELLAKAKAYVVSETKVRIAVLAAVVDKAVLQKIAILRALVQEALDRNWNMDSVLVADTIGLSYARKCEPGEERKVDGAANVAIEQAIKTADELTLFKLAVAIGHAEAFEVGSMQYAEDERKEIAKVGKVYGVDSNAIAKRLEGLIAGNIQPSKSSAPAKTAPAKKAIAKSAPAKKAVTKPAAKKAVAVKKAAPKKLSAEGRKRIADAMQKRFAARRKAAGK
jgi:ParB family chromosome partitioning protein